MAWKSWEYISDISHSAVLRKGKKSCFTESCFSLPLHISERNNLALNRNTKESI